MDHILVIHWVWERHLHCLIKESILLSYDVIEFYLSDVYYICSLVDSSLFTMMFRVSSCLPNSVLVYC